MRRRGVLASRISHMESARQNQAHAMDFMPHVDHSEYEKDELMSREDLPAKDAMAK